MDLDIVFLGTSASAPTAGARADRAARPPRRRPPALRLRRRHPAAAHALVARPARPRGDLPHPLPRRPLRSACRGMLKTFALRGRETAAHGLRPARAARAVRRPPPRVRQARVPARDDRGARRARRSSATATGSSSFPVHHGVSAVGYALVEEPDRPGRVRRRSRRRARHPVRARARCAAARRVGDARRRARRHARRRARRGPARAAHRDHRRHGAGRDRPRARRGRGRARPRGDVLRGGARPRRGDTPFDRAAGRRDRSAPPASGCSRSRTSRRATSGPSCSRRRRQCSRRPSAPRDFDVIEVPFAERGEPRLVRRGRAAAARRSR